MPDATMSSNDSFSVSTADVHLRRADSPPANQGTNRAWEWTPRRSARRSGGMRIGMLGSGRVGRTLGKGLADRGHEVTMGTRDPHSEAVAGWLAAAGDDAKATSYAEAAAWCELAVFVPVWEHAYDVVALSGPDNLAGKVVIDVTNPLGTVSGAMGILFPPPDGAGAHLQAWLPGSHVVKAFNMVGVELMVDPQLRGGPPTMFVCGDDEGAKSVVAEVLRSLGWEHVDLGGIDQSGYVEALAYVWIRYGRLTGEWDHAFKMLVG